MRQKTFGSRTRSGTESRGSSGRDIMHGTEGMQVGMCTAVIGSMTLAMKAQSALSDAAIRAGLTKISSGRTRNGCAYGVDFPCTQSANVRMILETAGIRVREYLQN